MAPLNRWQHDPEWVYSRRTHEHAYELLAQLPAHVTDRAWRRIVEDFGGAADVPGFGGVAYALDEDGILVVSGGEDALDALIDGADALADILDDLGFEGPVTWVQRPPVHRP